MFGNAFFGKVYYSDSFFGPAEGAVVAPPVIPRAVGGAVRTYIEYPDLPQFEELKLVARITLALRGKGEYLWSRGQPPGTDKNLAFANIILFGTARYHQNTELSDINLILSGYGDAAYIRGEAPPGKNLEIENKSTARWVAPVIELFKPTPEPQPEPILDAVTHYIAKLDAQLKGRGISSYIDGEQTQSDVLVEELAKIIQHTETPVLPEPNIEHLIARLSMRIEGSATVQILNNIDPKNRESEHILLLFAQIMAELDDEPYNF